MIKFSNDDYRTPRDRGMGQRGGYNSTRLNTETARYDCRGNPVSENNSMERGDCYGVGVPSSCIGGVSLASVYAPVQYFKDIYDPYVALSRGTLFKALDKPLKGDR